MTDDIIAAIAIVLIVGAAVAYIIKAKKSGQKCVGCPYSKSCSGGCGSCAPKEENCTCHSENADDKQR